MTLNAEVFEGFSEPTYTQTPNEFFEIIMSKGITLSEVKILAFMIRYTFGWQKAGWGLQFTFKEIQNVTKMGSQQVDSGLERCLEKKYIERSEIAGSYVYRLRMKSEDELPWDVTFNWKKHVPKQQKATDNEHFENQSGRHFENQSGQHFENQSDDTLKIKAINFENQSDDALKITADNATQPQATQGLADSLKTSIKDNTYKDISKDNNKEIVVASNVVSISEIESHKTLLKTVVSDRVSDATINTWLRYGKPDQILKAWYKANEVSGVEDIGAYVTWMLKDGITSLDQKKTKQTEPEQNHPFYEMMRAAEEAAVTNEISEPETIAPQVPEISSQEVWDNVLSELQIQLSAPAFETWVKPLIVLDCTQNQIVIKAKDDFHKDWLEQRYSVMIRNAVKTVMNSEATIKFVV